MGVPHILRGKGGSVGVVMVVVVVVVVFVCDTGILSGVGGAGWWWFCGGGFVCDLRVLSGLGGAGFRLGGDVQALLFCVRSAINIFTLITAFMITKHRCCKSKKC